MIKKKKQRECMLRAKRMKKIKIKNKKNEMNKKRMRVDKKTT